jgi:hypothetical protein
MSGVDRRLVSALREQLSRRSGDRVGWKLGVGDRERIGGHIAVGHLSSATVFEPGAVYSQGGRSLHADAEIVVEIGSDEEIAAYGTALELVDLGTPPDDPCAVVVENVFHRAVAFGSMTSQRPSALTGSLVVNGEVRATAEADADLDERLAEARRILAAVGEQLRPGDRVITGSVVQVPVEPGDEVVADLGPLGRAWLSVG